MCEPELNERALKPPVASQYELYCVILGLYRDNGKENGSYYIIIGYIFGLYWHSLDPYSSPL